MRRSNLGHWFMDERWRRLASRGRRRHGSTHRRWLHGGSGGLSLGRSAHTWAATRRTHPWCPRKTATTGNRRAMEAGFAQDSATSGARSDCPPASGQGRVAAA
jgi:hypothetical protein